VEACGGEHGGLLNLTRTGFDKLSFVSGDEIPSGSVMIAPNETREWSAIFAPRVHSEVNDDVVLAASLAEYETEETIQRVGELTVVKVELTPVVMRDGCEHRHIVGVYERIFCQVFPNAIDVYIEGIGGGSVEMHNTYAYYDCPGRGENGGLRFTYGNNQYSSCFSVIEPEALVVGVCKEVAFVAPTNTAGAVGMNIELFAAPLTVSFKGLSMMEIPTISSIPPEGMLADDVFSEIWNHTKDRGAGVFYCLRNDNFVFEDEVKFAVAIESPWQWGKIVWDIPIGWAQRESGDNDPCIGILPVQYQQIFEIHSTGRFRLTKFNYWVERAADGSRARSNGVVIQ
jgi:hypothetical protein